MNKASEYRKHAAECRQLAGIMDGEQKQLMLEMASTWERLAQERSELVRRHPEVAVRDPSAGSNG